MKNLIEEVENDEGAWCDKEECCIHDHKHMGQPSQLKIRILAALKAARSVPRREEEIYGVLHCTGCGVGGWEWIDHKEDCPWVLFDAAMLGEHKWIGKPMSEHWTTHCSVCGKLPVDSIHIGGDGKTWKKGRESNE